MGSGGRRKWWVGAGVGLVVAGAAVAAVSGCGQSVRRGLVSALTPEYEAQGDPSALKAEFGGPDASLERVEVALREVASGLRSPVDLQFVPGEASLLVALEQPGRALWLDLEAGSRGTLLEVEALHEGEQGLLGLAFDPKFKENGRFYINYTAAGADGDETRIEAWAVTPGADLRREAPRRVRVLLRVGQPYQNHNAGQLAFGPDGMLYVGMGDGGFADDPHGHGQDLGTLLGAMLRLDVSASSDEAPYAVPKDNPLVGRQGARPEIWAWGLRNPWRYAFAPDGRLVVADVGQDTLEEVSIVGAGQNMGWKIREGDRCFEPEEGCQTEGLTEPIHTYGRDLGMSITGGCVATDTSVPGLSGRYTFADFVTGRFWALTLPAQAGARAEVVSLGKWPLLPSTFGCDAAGRVYVADYNSGRVFRMEAPQAPGAGQ